MPYRHLIDGCFPERTGETGLSANRYESARGKASDALVELYATRDPETVAVLKIAERRDDLHGLQEIATQFQDNCEDVLVVGTGGSSLGAKTLCALAAEGTGPKIHFLENVDPIGVDRTLNTLDPKRTGAVFASKSGGTLETISLTMVVLDWLRRAHGTVPLANPAYAITLTNDNPLSRLANQYGIPLLAHDPHIGGRYSVFSAVGLLPAMIAGLDGAAIRAGAEKVVRRSIEAPEAAAPVEGAALAEALLTDCGISISVLMPYRDQLAELGLWYRQLWAESLGKDGRGTTPIQAAGSVDQHSQLQLYLDGPADKLITLITCSATDTGATIPADLAHDAGLDHLGNRRIGDLLDAFSGATADALKERGRPVREIRLQALDAHSLGGVLMHFILETLVTARLWKIDPFGQPAVESGKKRALARLALGPEDAT